MGQANFVVQVRARLSKSLGAHVRDPLLLLVAVATAVSFFVLDAVSGPGEPHAADLARIWAPPPLDVYSDFRFAEGRSTRWLPLALFPLRVSVVALYLFVLTRVVPRGKQAFKFVGLYGLCVVSFVIPFLIAVSFVTQSRAAGITGGLVVWGSAILNPAAHLVIVGFLSAAVVAAYCGLRTLRKGDLAHWLICAGAVWVWLFLPARIERLESVSLALAFATAFVAVALQSILFSAIVLEVSARTESG